jgi:anti-sigma factor RsiW
MTAPRKPEPELSPELLAAYADGELDAEARDAVARWLANHAAARAELEAQRELGPANAGLWERAEPPEPSEEAWATVGRGIKAALHPLAPGPGRWRKPAAWTAGGLVAAAVAAAVAWVVLAPAEQPPRSPRGPGQLVKRLPRPPVASPPHMVSAAEPDPLAGFAVLPVADDEDVILARVPDTRTGWLPVGQHPLPDVMVLATLEEVELQEADPSPAWPGGPKMTTAPGDSPMIFAAKPR